MKTILLIILAVVVAVPLHAKQMVRADGCLVDIKEFKGKRGITVTTEAIVVESDQYKAVQAQKAIKEKEKQEERDINEMIQIEIKNMATEKLILDGKLEYRAGKLKKKNG